MKEERNDILKVIAAIFMLIDHIGAVFFPNAVILRAIGRISFPIFAYYIAMGFYRTSDLKKYMMRMFIFALITQIPYSFFSLILLGHFYYLNVLFTFTIALMALYFLVNKNYLLTVAIVLIPQLVESFTLLELDYGTYGVLMVCALYAFKSDKVYRFLSVLFLTVAYAFSVYIPMGFPFYYSFLHLQNLSILALALLDIDYIVKVKLPRYFFYLFYPAHIGLIVVVYYLLP